MIQPGLICCEYSCSGKENSSRKVTFLAGFARINVKDTCEKKAVRSYLITFRWEGSSGSDDHMTHPSPLLHSAPRCLGHSSPYRHDNVAAPPRRACEEEIFQFWAELGPYLVQSGPGSESDYAMLLLLSSVKYIWSSQTKLGRWTNTEAKNQYCIITAATNALKRVFHWRGLKICCQSKGKQTHFSSSAQKKAKGEELFDQIMYHLDLVEKDYFGLRFMDSAQVPVGLRPPSTFKPSAQLCLRFLLTEREGFRLGLPSSTGAKGIGAGTIVASAGVRPRWGIKRFSSRPGCRVPIPRLRCPVKAVEGGKDERRHVKKDSVERGVEAASQKAGKARSGGRGRAVIGMWGRAV